MVADVPMLIDTGADVTLVPYWVIDALKDVPLNESNFSLEGFDGTRTKASSVNLTLHWLGKRFHGEFFVIDQPHGILGRNILNNVTITLHGKQNEWEG
jgi:hypothetical protein